MPTELAATAPPADYASAFEVSGRFVDRSAEDWARATFEDAPRSLRWLLLLGWRAVLRLRLAPLDDPTCVLGWRLVQKEHGQVSLAVESPLLVARKVVRARPEGVVAATFVSYRTWYAPSIWAMASVVHHVTEPMLLSRAAARAPRSGTRRSRP